MFKVELKAIQAYLIINIKLYIYFTQCMVWKLPSITPKYSIPTTMALNVRKYYINFRERVKENNVLLLLSTVSPIIFILSATKATCSRENFVYQMIRLYSIKKEKLNQSTFSPGLPIVQAFCRSSVFLHIHR